MLDMFSLWTFVCPKLLLVSLMKIPCTVSNENSWLFAYCQRNRLELPERAFINRTMDKASELIQYEIEKVEGECRPLTGIEGDDNLKEPTNEMFIYLELQNFIISIIGLDCISKMRLSFLCLITLPHVQ